MIGVGLLFALAAVDPGGPCSPEQHDQPERLDPAAARVYRAVGDGARMAGDDATAKVAYREALARNPADADSRAALEALCRAAAAPALERAGTVEPRARDRFDEGVALMRGGDRARAVAVFEEVRATGPDPAAALLEGICAYELGDDRRARPLFAEARREPKVAGTALFFLGLIAVHDGDGDTASSLLQLAAASDAAVAGAASGLLRLARRDGRLVASALAESGYDSNVELTPDGTPTRGGTGDGYGTGVLGLFARPLGITGPYARATAQYRKQLQITGYDLGDVGAAVGARAGRGGQYLAAEYAYDWLALGGAPYLSAHRLLGTGRMTWGRLSLGATYAARFESFLTAATKTYSGLRHDGEVMADWRTGAGAALGLGYHLGRDAISDRALAYVEHGPQAIFRFGLGGPMRLFAEGRFTLRAYDASDPDLLVQRADRYLDGALSGELDLADHWTLRLAGTARRALSNVADFQYSRLTVALGLVYTAGAL